MIMSACKSGVLCGMTESMTSMNLAAGWSRGKIGGPEMPSEPVVQQQLSQPAELHRYCLRCHRKLKAERSMKAGFGPVCLLREGQERAAEVGQA
jgi:hypothetical protein